MLQQIILENHSSKAKQYEKAFKMYELKSKTMI
jgi:hypothetical protein